MPELHLQRSGSTLDIILGEHRSSFPLADVALSATTWQHIYDDTLAYGRELFDKTFRDEQMQALLANLPANERLLLVAEDPLIAAIPWEYLRDQNNKLVASRLNFVRAIPEAQRRENFSFAGPLEIVAIPISPIDEPSVLNVEREWKNLVEAVTVTRPPLKSLTLKRVRPPTRSQLERSLSRQGTSIVHFMGHSTSHDGKAFLVFEDARARKHLVDAADFTDSLNDRVFLVVLNSCLSAVVAHTDFGNIAQALILRGVPYALGMQFILPDDAALVLSDALYDFLLQERSVEEAVMHARRALEEPGKLSNPHWLAGIPALYTSLRTPAPPIKLAAGQPTIQPDPQQLEKTCDLTGLPQATHFVGRGREINEVLDALLAHRPPDFVVLHGLGGIGKTSLAREVAERVSYHYGNRVLAISFEIFAPLDAHGMPFVDKYFTDRFYSQLAHFYELDPAAYNTIADLQRAILQRRMHLRSLLVLDNIETLIDAQRTGHSAAKALATFISRLKEGDGATLLTSRIIPPSDWGDCKIISVSGLTDEAGGNLLLALVPPDRRFAALPDMHRKLSQRVKGHPLSIQLLAGRFAEATIDLETFLKEIEAELQAAEQLTPTSLEDPERQATLYACMAYSINRLKPEQVQVLRAVSIFKAPFPPEFAVAILDDEEQTLIHLQDLVHLGLLETNVRTIKDGELVLLELHPILRWFVQHHLPVLEPELLERYGWVYERLVRQAHQSEEGYDQSARIRYLVRQSLPDLDAALEYLPPADRSMLAYYLAEVYGRLGQNWHALALYEQALEIYQEQNIVQGITSTQRLMAELLRQLGRPQEALVLVEQALRTHQDLGDIRGVSNTQHALATLLRELGRPQEALVLVEQALRTYQDLGNLHGVAITQSTIAELLVVLGRPQEALTFYEQALCIAQDLGDVRGVANVQSNMAGLLVVLDRPQEALTLYEQALRADEDLGDVRNVAIIQTAMADLLGQLGRPQEALVLFERALRTKQDIGDVREISIVQDSMADLLKQLGRLPEALALYEQALRAAQDLGDLRGVSVTQNNLASLLKRLGRLSEAVALYEQALHAAQDLGDVNGIAAVQANFSQLLSQLGQQHRALTMAWEAYNNLKEKDYIQNTRMAQQVLVSMKVESAEFDTLWEQAINEPQPGWLSNVQAGSSDEQGNVSPEQLEIVVANTISAMTDMPEKRAEWREIITAFELQSQRFNRPQEAEFFTAILAILVGQRPSLPEGHQYSNEFTEILSRIATEEHQVNSVAIDVSHEVIQAVEDFLNAEDWDAKRHIVEERQTYLFQQEVETLFKQFIEQERATGEQRVFKLLEQHLAILRSCKTKGIAATFEEFARIRQQSLLFDAELIPHSIAALLGSPQEKKAYMQYLAEQMAQATDGELKTLLQVIQLALFSNNDLSQLGRDLKGIYRQAWETIAATVEAGGVDPRTLELIASNTLAVLGPASNQRSEWRSNLVELRNQAMTGGDRNLAALLGAVIGLLDAGGDPEGLGESLQGVYAKTWQAIVDGLSL